ncbi:MAG: c-type cytochrome biogenesis protein CcsB [Deltaproteobacteria bacterium]|nr:c-type cytochrome biogenesis protein CcsB [Deltaproteobacteria bacterium]
MILKVALAVYLLSTIFCLVYFVSPRKSLATAYLASAVAGFLIHTWVLIESYLQAGHIPVTNLKEGLSFFSWTIILIFLIIEYRYKILILGSFIIPPAFIALLYPALAGDRITALAPLLQSSWLGVHVTLAFLGDASFALATALSVMYILQERQLKSHKFGATFRKLPSLEVLDLINHRIMTIGFLLLTLGIITGALWARAALGSYIQGDPREIWSLITWVIYAGLVHSRLTIGWRGRKSAILTIVGFCVLIFAFLAINTFIPSYHYPGRF